MSEKRAVPLPEVGDGVSIHFKASDLAALQAAVTSENNRQDWLARVFTGLDTYSPDIIEICLRYGLKGGDPKFAPWSLTLADLSVRIADAIMLILHGKTVSEMNAERAAAEKTVNP
jgi:hypothetical protein